MARTTLVTGANRGLGLEFARQLAARGDTVLATARDPQQAAELRAITPHVHALDVASEASVAALAKALAGRPIDLLINNAGVSDGENSVGKLTFAGMQRVMNTNAIAPAILTQHLLPNLRAAREKKVLMISSTLGSISQAMPGFSYAYCASKAALNMITAKLAKDLAGESFTVVTFCPGWNKTDMGGSDAPLMPADSIRSLLAVADRLGPRDSGTYLSHEGQPIPW